ncbi:hypothetical protein C7S20_05075 [Christiangramia fulva]|uniref:ABM domain-containing protein n=1 Tax=Christiangramia fulva TaxID=2126553 RepID=A0A2R3Z346_9FLAO|nr:DUF4286 family protein [Christiangramia fulva]AVR44686.1 hypothetical protein C7S20_05075 [Christiangramia fulva]
MIARQWTCELKPDKNLEYENFLKEEILPELSALKGFHGASIKKNISGNEYMFTSEWENLESIKAFAGENISRAVVKEKAQQMMVRFDKEVKHYEIRYRQI